MLEVKLQNRIKLNEKTGGLFKSFSERKDKSAIAS